jgi:DNA-binding LytR/AlgR family response regulator
VTAPLRVLAVDDEPLALAELGFLLGEHPRVGVVRTACDGVQTLRLLKTESFDVVLLDVSMPGLDGVEVAEILRHLPDCPALVFVTAHEGRAAEAFGLDAADYVLKPVSAARLDDAVRRVERRLASTGQPTRSDAEDLSVIPVEAGGSTRFVHRRDVVYAEAHGDYVRLRTVGREGGLHTVRMSLTTLEERWGAVGFVRVHRSYLVALRAVSELRKDPLGGQLVRVAGHDLPVSRRHARALRERLQSSQVPR